MLPHQPNFQHQASDKYASDVKRGGVKTIQKQSLNNKATAEGLRVNDARVIKTDVMASNRVIHVSDTVVPPD